MGTYPNQSPTDNLKSIYDKNHIHVTLLRDPVDCWESNYVYMGLQNAFKMDINEFAASEKVENSKILK